MPVPVLGRRRYRVRLDIAKASGGEKLAAIGGRAYNQVGWKRQPARRAEARGSI
jgi:hypothetical protein